MREFIKIVESSKYEGDYIKDHLFYIEVMKNYIDKIQNNREAAQMFPRLDDDILSDAFAQTLNRPSKPQDYNLFCQICQKRGQRIYG